MFKCNKFFPHVLANMIVNVINFSSGQIMEFECTLGLVLSHCRYVKQNMMMRNNDALINTGHLQ